MTKPWRALQRAEVDALPGQLGVYQLADAGGRVIHIGFAGGRSLFGLRGALADELAARGEDSGVRFRVEVTMSYLTRYQELLMAYRADHGELPEGNRGVLPVTLGRLSPG